jgi:hypothetical protein
MTKRLLAGFLLALLPALAAAQPALPQIWVDNNEATDGLSYAPPLYELTLPGTWSIPPGGALGPPADAGCVFHTPYGVNAAGKQSAINDIENCRTIGISLAHKNCVILDVPPGQYPSANGVVIPQTSSVLAGCSNVIRSTMWATLAALPEPVCAGGVQDNIPTSLNIGLRNPTCDASGVGLPECYVSGSPVPAVAYQLGATTLCITTSSFNLANGTATSLATYNYYQYLYEDICTGSGCNPFALCSASVLGGANPCASANIGPDHWLFEDGAASMIAGSTLDRNMVLTGDNFGAATALTQYATHIHFRRYWVHGDWTTLIAGRNSIINGFNFNECVYCSVVGSQMSMALRPGAEGHAVVTVGTNFKIDNNWFEGQSSCIFAGGQSNVAGPAITPIGSYVPFQDVQLGRNRCTFPYSWLGQLNGKVPAGNTQYAGQSIVRKNCQEMKEGKRVLIYGLICENVDASGGQAGVLLAASVRNTSGSSFGQNYQAVITDLTIRDSLFRNSCEGSSFGARSLAAGGGLGVSQPMDRVALTNLLHYNVSVNNFAGGGTAACAGNDRGIKLVSGNQTWQGTIVETGGTSATFTAVASVDDGVTVTAAAPSGPITAYTVLQSSCGGSPTACAAYNQVLCGSAPGVFTGGFVLVSGFGDSNDSPITGFRCFSSTSSSLTLTNNAGIAESIGAPIQNNANPIITNTTAIGFQVLGIPTGFPASVTGCNDATFNVPTTVKNGHLIPLNVGPLTTVGSTPWNGTWQVTNAQVTYPWVSTHAAENSGSCILSNVEGGPGHVLITHNTYVTDTDTPIGSGPTISGGPNFSFVGLFRDSIFLTRPTAPAKSGGWWNQSLASGEGKITETYGWDSGSLTADHLVWPSRPAGSNANYTEYSNNPSYSGGCPGAGCTPPNTMFFPATDYCTGAIPTSTCVGFVGAMNALSMPLALADYHGYALRADSSFYNTASDGTPYGVNLAAIDSAQTTNLYVCPIACGSPGPYPDIFSVAPQVPSPTAPAAKAFAALDSPRTGQGGHK